MTDVIVQNITTINLPIANEVRTDIILTFVSIFIGMALTIIYFATGRRYQLLLVLGGVGMEMFSIAFFIARASITTRIVIANGTMTYVLEPNPMIRIYTAPMLIGLLMLVVWFLELMRTGVRSLTR